MKTSMILGIASLTILGCTHTQVAVRQSADDRLNCTEIATQTAEINRILRDIDDKTGMSGRNVAMGIFFWPGIVVNQMNAGDARKAANERLAVLSGLSAARKCS